MLLHRYPSTRGITTALDPMEDVINWIKGFQSIEFLTDLIHEVHLPGAPSKEVKRTSLACASHIRLGIEYLDQALSSTQEVSFLPLYYACLNLAKVCVLVGPWAAFLPTQRYHGAAYDPSGKHNDLMSESITIRKAGAIQLFNWTITGLAIPDKTIIHMADVYSYISDISAEYAMSGRQPLMVPIKVELSNVQDKWRVECTLGENVLKVSNARLRSHLPILKGLRRVATGYNSFVSRRIISDPGDPPIQQVRNLIRTYLIGTYAGHSPESGDLEFPMWTPVSKREWLPVEELCILMALFHLSSVVRYNPPFFDILAGSKYWPVVLALRRHGIFKFLLAFFSFMRQESVYIRGSS